VSMNSNDQSTTWAPGPADILVEFNKRFQYLLDKTVIYTTWRWLGFVALLALYFTRIYFINGWYIVTYGLGIYLLNLFIGFLTPQIDPELEGPTLPTKLNEEFKPFNRKIPEFKFWYAAIRGVVVAFGMTLFSLFNIPVFWPILLMYFIILFGMTMKARIQHMIKHRYLPFNLGKAKYSGGKSKKDGDSDNYQSTRNVSTGALFSGSNLR
jgi:Rer1 family